VTPERSVGRELGGTNLGAHMDELYKRGIEIRPDMRLTALSRVGNRLLARIENIYNEAWDEIEIDQVVGENGTLPNDDLYFALKPLSKNLGEADIDAMTRFAPQEIVANPEGAFMLLRIGDAWAGRNIHAATLDAMRFCKDL
ncbi:MAG: N-methylproline demethylase, partial [Rhodospirillaceae bacterium]|nr:N-methylproline demethylase [Rhodospirillaceae bacterium]